MPGSQTSTDTCSCSSFSPASSDMLKALPLASYDSENEENVRVAAQVDVVLEMIATFDAEGFQEPPKVTRREVQSALEACDGDITRAVDDVLSLVAIKTLRQDEQQALQARQGHPKLELSELCSSLGLEPDCSFIVALEQLTASEQEDLLQTNGAFVQQLLLTLDEEEERDDGKLNEDMHPLQYLLALYPDYKAQVVEDVLDSHAYDVESAAEALYNLRALRHVQSYASVVSADACTAAKHQALVAHGPQVESRTQFPELTSRTKAQQQTPQYRPPPKPLPPPIAFPRLPARERHVTRNTEKTVSSAWNASQPGLTTLLKLERLEKLLPDIERSVIQTTFLLNGCSSDATEAALREAYGLPLTQPPFQWVSEVEMAESAARTEEERLAADNTRREGGREEWKLVSSKRKVKAARERLSNRYCDVLASFRRGQHVLAGDRVRELSKARHEHREAQREWAHAFFLAHQEHLKHQRPIDLHGMIVMEALWVARAAIEFCQTHRIRRCLLICGVGHHSIKGKARILAALQLSLTRRHIAYRELQGVVTVFPLRSTASC